MATPIIPASLLTRLAADWQHRAMAGKLTEADYDRWFAMYPNAVAEATREEAAALLDADCAVELSLH